MSQIHRVGAVKSLGLNRPSFSLSSSYSADFFFLNDDEYMEVTPESIRLRKQILNKAEREKANKKKKSAE
ncbi:BipA family GTPase [Streptococcus pneumoniae]|nr:BipA family GTPase [Streptococcus pneumoniae]